MEFSDRVKILSFLKGGGVLTTKTAREKFGTTELRSRVAELRKVGHPISDKWIKTTEGARVKEYKYETIVNTRTVADKTYRFGESAIFIDDAEAYRRASNGS